MTALPFIVSRCPAYAPRLRRHRVSRGRKIEEQPLLFPSYVFVSVLSQWHAARWAPGVVRLVMDGEQPAHVPDRVIADIRKREVRGLIELPRPPGLQRGDRVRVVRGPLVDRLGLYHGMGGRDRVLVLLRLLGGERRVVLAAGDVRPVAYGD